MMGECSNDDSENASLAHPGANHMEYQVDVPFLAHSRTSYGQTAFHKAASRDRQLLADSALCAYTFSIIPTSSSWRKTDITLLYKSTRGRAFLVTTGHDFVSTINGKK